MFSALFLAGDVNSARQSRRRRVLAERLAQHPCWLTGHHDRVADVVGVVPQVHVQLNAVAAMGQRNVDDLGAGVAVESVHHDLVVVSLQLAPPRIRSSSLMRTSVRLHGTLALFGTIAIPDTVHRPRHVGKQPADWQPGRYARRASGAPSLPTSSLPPWSGTQRHNTSANRHVSDVVRAGLPVGPSWPTGGVAPD